MITFQRNAEDLPLLMGLDVGSTTVKIVLFDTQRREVLWSRYTRHYSDVARTLLALVTEMHEQLGDHPVALALTGSAGIGVSRKLELAFVQEVIANAEAISVFLPQTDVAIELGGEDAKITYFQGSIDQRMNETCAGGTGAFIDQIAVTLKTDAAGIDALAATHKTIYPIAARCGVFTKSDVTMLLNEGASREDIAASVLQAVVEQTIGGLACGRKIRGNVAFLGGPLHFLPQLRRRFVETLQLSEEETIVPENAHFFVALGAALFAGKLLEKSNQPSHQSVPSPKTTLAELWQRLTKALEAGKTTETDRLPPLFLSQEQYDQFRVRHEALRAGTANIAQASGPLFLGIDAGSTTTKAVLLDAHERIVFSWYGPNDGDPIHTVLKILAEIYDTLPKNAFIENSCVTGYGEALLRAALGIEEGEVETLAHHRAAAHFLDDVSFILDIGGQDIKCISIKDGHIEKIILNEACSSGCGSFVETFACSLGFDVETFAQEAVLAEHPIDLGTRCTVFMNSKVKQAQKENAPVSDISAGLAYSVAKNALYKVLKIADASELGERVMVQGGTFNNPAVLRALELLIGREVFRTDISGLMGAFGAALIAKERSRKGVTKTATLITKDAITGFSVETKLKRCQACSNKCLTSIHRFSGGKTFVSGNKCERGLGKTGTNAKLNLFRYQYERLFEYYEPLTSEKAFRGEIGLPRVLNMYENYPFWFTFFQELGFRVVLSDPSSQRLYNKGIESVSSQTLCFPAKLVHGHIMNLLEKGVKRIFYPALPLERKEFVDTVYTFNCPVVGSYPEVVRLNIDEINEQGVELVSPFLPWDDPGKLQRHLYDEFQSREDFKTLKIRRGELKRAIRCASEEQREYKNDLRREGEAALRQLLETGEPAIILAGRPYHLDPLIHHGIPELIAAGGAAVLGGDCVAHLGRELLFPLQVVDQWGYHARLYRAATFTALHDRFQMVQLTSFGCGLDAVTAEQVAEILASVAKVHTLLKIDEGTQLGAVKIRIRSLLSTQTNAVESAKKSNKTSDKKSEPRP